LPAPGAETLSEYDAWAPVNDAWSAHSTEDVAHYVDLAGQADGPIVELAVGSGRVALAWATRSESEGLVDVAGREIEAQYGWFDKRPLTDDSPELVFVTRKP
jgi:hypothetical protein